MKALNRRMFFGVSAGAIAAGMGACATTPAETEAQWTAFVDQVTAIVAVGCSVVTGFIPTVASVAAVVASLFGAGAVVSTISGAVEAVAKELCSALTPAVAPTVAARLRGSTEDTPVVIGVTPHNIVVRGYSVRAGMHRSRYH